MKKHIKQIILLTLLTAFTSCTENSDAINMPGASGRSVLGASESPVRVSADAKIKRTETAKTISIFTFLKEGVTLTSLTVYTDINSENNPDDGVPQSTTSGKKVLVGTKVADATVTGSLATFNSSALSTNAAFDPAKTKNSKIYLAFVATFSDGLTLTNGGVLTVTP
jgi:hypothetical protein